MKHIFTNPRSLVRPRRLDITVKWRFFRHVLIKHDQDAVDLYRWHIEQRSGSRMAAGLVTDKWKRSVSDYLVSAEALARSVAAGYDPANPIPVDRSGDILDGSHRLAAVLVVGVSLVPIDPMDTLAWAPAWDRAWFLSHGLPANQVAALESDLAALRGT